MPEINEHTMYHMPELDVKQLQYESDAWKKFLVLIMDENIQYKNRIPEILKLNFDPALLVTLENFQTSLIKEDTRVALLRNEVAEFDRLLQGTPFQDGQILKWKEIKWKSKQIQQNIICAAQSFTSLKTAFSDCLPENA